MNAENQTPTNESLKTPIRMELLHKRSVGSLRRQGIATYGDLVQRSEMELLKSGSIGRTAVKQLKNMLREVGLTLKGGILTEPAPPARRKSAQRKDKFPSIW